MEKRTHCFWGILGHKITKKMRYGGPPPRRRADCVGRCAAAVVLMLIPVVVVASLPSELGVLVPLGRVLD